MIPELLNCQVGFWCEIEYQAGNLGRPGELDQTKILMNNKN